ncbi:MAG TPA: ABC transporter permease [Ilumatobacter sp.]|nr:ABC transporter permease [Ilumatobacter sp.]
MTATTPPAAARLGASRLHLADVGRTSVVGLRTRKLRAALSALGIMIGIASMVAVLGLSESSRSDLLARLDRLGTNLLRVEAGMGIGRGSGALPEEAAGMVARIGPVEMTATAARVGANVYRNDLVPAGESGGISVQAVSTNLLATLQGSVASGVFLDEAAADYPVVVLGSVAAQRLGITDASTAPLVWLGGEWFTVVGVLDQFELSPDLDRAALVSTSAAERFLDDEGVPSTIFVRTDPAYVDQVLAVLAATANPQTPEEVEVTRPSDALEARDAADEALTALFLGLGAVALLVGGVGIANVMVISVLERRSEIGLRRAIGATRRHVAAQFVGEALVLSLIGGVGGVVLGWGATAVWARVRGWSVLVPPEAMLGGVAAALVIGVVAGLYPAVRAARMAPTDALRN